MPFLLRLDFFRFFIDFQTGQFACHFCGPVILVVLYYVQKQELPIVFKIFLSCLRCLFPRGFSCLFTGPLWFLSLMLKTCFKYLAIFGHPLLFNNELKREEMLWLCRQVLLMFFSLQAVEVRSWLCNYISFLQSLCFSLWLVHFVIYIRNLCLNQGHRDFLSSFFLINFKVFVLFYVQVYDLF